jgi:polyisoprenoid-binding protein YceI
LANAAEFKVLRPQQSSVTFVSRQMGVSVESGFKKFEARIVIDPAKPEKGTARIDLDLTSIDTGNSDADKEVTGKDWFDCKNYPSASFVSSAVKSLGQDHYETQGKLTIKGKSMDVKAPFTLQQKGDSALLTGSFMIKRLDYNIGAGIWSDTDTVADAVQINFRFTVANK